MSLVQVQDKFNRTEHDHGYPCRSSIVMQRTILIGAYGGFANVRVEFDVDGDPAINRNRCEQLQQQMADMARHITEAASAPQVNGQARR